VAVITNPAEIIRILEYTSTSTAQVFHPQPWASTMAQVRKAERKAVFVHKTGSTLEYRLKLFGIVLPLVYHFDKKGQICNLQLIYTKPKKK